MNSEKLQILQELDRRGELPSKYQPIMDELKRREWEGRAVEFRINPTAIRPTETPEPTFTEDLIGKGEAALTLGTGAVGGTVGGVGGFANALARELVSGEFGTPSAADRIERGTMEGAQALTYAPRTQQGIEDVRAIGKALGPLSAVAPPLAAEMAPLRASVQAMRMRQARPLRPHPRKVAEDVRLERKALAKPSKALMVRDQAGRQVNVAEQIKQNPYNPDFSGYRLLGDRAMKDALSTEAAKQGFDPGVLATIKASSKQDLGQMLKMLKIHRTGRKDATYRGVNRPADALGQTVEAKIKYLLSTHKDAGKEVNRAAKRLPQSVNYDNAMRRFAADLKEAGISVVRNNEGKLRAVLKGSDVEGDRASQQLLNRIFERLGETDAPNGYGLHKAKQFIDTQVNWRKQGANPLSAKTERIVKNLRHELNESLRAVSEPYRKANDKASATFDALKDFGDTVGKNVDIDSPNLDKSLGQVSRRLLSNYQSRIPLTDAMDKLDRVIRQYGYKVDDSPMNQLVVVNELDRMFGAPAPMSFKGQIEQALRTGQDVARSSAAENAFRLASKMADKTRGINEEAALNVLEQLIKREISK